MMLWIFLILLIYLRYLCKILMMMTINLERCLIYRKKIFRSFNSPQNKFVSIQKNSLANKIISSHIINCSSSSRINQPLEELIICEILDLQLLHSRYLLNLSGFKVRNLLKLKQFRVQLSKIMLFHEQLRKLKWWINEPYLQDKRLIFHLVGVQLRWITTIIWMRLT